MARPFAELRESGMLWLINRVVFHPRGFALALDVDDKTGEAVGWSLRGDGSEVFVSDITTDDAHFADAERTLADAREAGAL
jgi:hypothetical protein